jgi:hypothetical protein
LTLDKYSNVSTTFSKINFLIKFHFFNTAQRPVS